VNDLFLFHFILFFHYQRNDSKLRECLDPQSTLSRLGIVQSLCNILPVDDLPDVLHVVGAHVLVL
jgi:hypothetical protein